MTIIKNDGADSFLRRAHPEIRFYLVHGADEGLIHERVRSVVRSALAGDADPLSVCRFEGDAVAREPGGIFDEAYSISMFGGRRVIWVEAQSRDLAPALEQIMSRPPEDCTIVVEAGNLKKGNLLRAMFEGSSNAASIECYPDERRSLVELIDAEASNAKLVMTPEARDYLVILLGSDRLATRGELAKLMLYSKGAQSIAVGDVEAIVTEAAPSELESIIDHSLSGNVFEVEVRSGRFFSDGGDAGLLLMRLIARLMLLQNVRIEMEQGRAFDAALQVQFVRLSPNGRAALARQAERWTCAGIGRRLPVVHFTAARVRRDPRLAPFLVTRLLWSLATSSQTARQ
jgi:DNA polymerase-3 subunit delta